MWKEAKVKYIFFVLQSAKFTYFLNGREGEEGIRIEQSVLLKAIADSGAHLVNFSVKKNVQES